MHELSNMDFPSQKLIWLLPLLSAQSVKGRDTKPMVREDTIFSCLLTKVSERLLQPSIGNTDNGPNHYP